MLETMKNCIENRKVLILGFGREGKSTYKLIEKAGGYQSLAIADLNSLTDILPENVLQITGKEYQKSLNEYDLV